MMNCDEIKFVVVLYQKDTQKKNKMMNERWQKFTFYPMFLNGEARAIFWYKKKKIVNYTQRKSK